VSPRRPQATPRRQLVYRVTEFRYETDYYHQFVTLPGVMITEKTRNWLADAGLFRQVVPPGSPVVPTYILDGNVTALYGDFTDPSAPMAVAEIRFSLLSSPGSGENVIFSRTYRATTPLTARTADAVVAALDRDLTEILTRLTADLQDVLAGRAGQNSPLA
jgi:cholesterol transport system auxiliary component